MELMNALRRANHMETRWCLAACSCCSVYIAFLRQRAVPEAASAARARTSFRRSSVDGGGTGREKSPKNRGRHGAAPLIKWSSATRMTLVSPGHGRLGVEKYRCSRASRKVDGVPIAKSLALRTVKNCCQHRPSPGASAPGARRRVHARIV